MSGNREIPTPSIHRVEQEGSFVDFLLNNPGVTAGHTAATRVFFGLDDVLFSRSCETATALRGSWRPDMPAIVHGLLEEGFALSVLAHASRSYVNAALEIYQQQFDYCPAKVFDAAFVLEDYSKFCNRGEAFPALSKETYQHEGKRSIFVDRFLSSLVIPTDITYICVPQKYFYTSKRGTTYYNSIDG